MCSEATCTVALAGGSVGKYSRYTALNLSKSLKFAMKAVTVTTSLKSIPAALRTSRIFASACRVSPSMPPGASLALTGSRPVWPDIYSVLPARIAGESGRPVFGAFWGRSAYRLFGVKDIYDVAGYKTGFGSPDWLATHGPATRTAPSVQILLDAGADLVGKTHTDELTYSLMGENAHYGTPINVNAPGRIPGGSSSGSAA